MLFYFSFLMLFVCFFLPNWAYIIFMLQLEGKCYEEYIFLVKESIWGDLL